MLKITIKNLQEVITHGPLEFSSQAELDSWLQSHISMGTFQFEDVLIPAVLDISGQEIQAEYIKPKTHTKEIEDMGDIEAQRKINEESQAYLDSTDWYILREVDSGVPCPQEIKEARAEARAKIIK